MTFDYIVVGQGLAGTFLSWNLRKAGKTVLVIDRELVQTSSKIASGVINPITGRRMVRSWMIETLMPFAVEAYTEFGKELGVDLIRQCNIIDFHSTPERKLAFEERLPEEKEYLRKPVAEDKWRTSFNYPFGYGETDPCWLVDLQAMLPQWRKKMEFEGSLLNETFSITDCVINNHEVRYHDIIAQKIFFCEGAVGANNPWFSILPFAKNKGQALIAEIDGLPRTNIFKQGITIVPWQNGLFWIGSSFEWEYSEAGATEIFRTKTEQQLSHWLKLPFRIVEQLAAERPATMERRPFVGLHPNIPSVGILNGFGTKGCTLAPYFAATLTDHLLNGSAIEPVADVKRFTRMLSRNQ